MTAGRMRRETRFITLTIGFNAGPAVSLKGSPTVSPMTAALWASDPLPPSWPSSMYFLELSRQDGAGQEGPEREIVDPEADDHRGQDGQQRRRGQLALCRGGADGDDS